MDTPGDELPSGEDGVEADQVVVRVLPFLR